MKNKENYRESTITLSKTKNECQKQTFDIANSNSQDNYFEDINTIYQSYINNCYLNKYLRGLIERTYTSEYIKFLSMKNYYVSPYTKTILEKMLQDNYNRIFHDFLNQYFESSNSMSNIMNNNKIFLGKDVHILSGEEINSTNKLLISKLNGLEYDKKKLLNELNNFKYKNIQLKNEILKNTPDKIVGAIGKSFLLFFSISIIFYYFFNYELLKIIWAKVGFFLSISIISIAYFVNKMFHKEF